MKAVENILLFDTNISAKPIYDYLYNTGNHVYVIGGNPDDSLAKLVKKNYINLDYRKIDKVIEILKSLNINFIVPGGNDESYRTCAIINEHIPFFNIDPPDVNKQINDKGKFRLLSKKLGLNIPQLVSVDKIEEFFPVIVKPVDSYSGQGITKIDKTNKDEMEKALKKAKRFSKEGNFLVEQFVTGQLFSHSAFVADGKIMIDFFVEEYCTKNPYAVNTSFVSNKIDKKTISRIRSDVTTLINELDLCDGIIHTQLIYDGDKFWIIEVTRRCPGDLYSNLIEYSNGFPYAEFYVKPFLNKKNNFNKINLKHNFIIRHTLTIGRDENFSTFKLNYPITLFEFNPLARVGYKTESGRIGLMFFGPIKNSMEDFRSILKHTIDNQLYNLK